MITRDGGSRKKPKFFKGKYLAIFAPKKLTFLLRYIKNRQWNSY